MDNTDEFMVRFWGVRGSYPVPGPSTLEFGGNTACVEVRAGGHLIILDAGTGIIGLGKELARRKVPVMATVLFSHTHDDHTQGFAFFDPAYDGTAVLYLFGPRAFSQDITEGFSRAVLAPTFPVALADLRSILAISNFVDESEVIVLDEGREPEIWNVHRETRTPSPEAVQIHLLRGYAHPKDGINIYRIAWRGKKVVYATDTESSYVGGDSRLIAFAREADVLIHDAQFTEDEYVATGSSKQGWGHSTPSMAVAQAKHSAVKRLVLFHHDPQHSDERLWQIERRCQQEFPNSIMAREGMVIKL
jgi:phosphoribosyl 1,2-cyclic phosphodiesterase